MVIVVAVTALVVASGGTMAAVLVPAAIGAGTSATVSVGAQLATTGEVNWEDVAVSASLGAAGGAVGAVAGPVVAASDSFVAAGATRLGVSLGPKVVAGIAEGGTGAFVASALSQTIDGDVDPARLAADNRSWWRCRWCGSKDHRRCCLTSQPRAARQPGQPTLKS